MRVLILGGGCAGMAAAWELSRTPERRSRFDVTVASLGWRLGGKGTTGRSARHGQRIHEHGLHVWMGFYRNAFGMMDDVFRHWRAPRGSRIATIEQAFEPHYTVSMANRQGHVLHLALPPTPGRPWDGSRGIRRWTRELREWRTRHLLPAWRANARDPFGTARHLGQLTRFARTVSRGLVSDGVSDFEALDDEDLMAWLARHGAVDPDVYDCSAVRAFYNLAFAYPDGRSGFGRGSVAAGAALSALLRMGLTYRGAPLFKMTAGMGDTVFVPLYEVLRDRGVRFELFRRVDRISAREGRIDEVALGVQAEAEGYDPLVEVRGERCWPDAPIRERLDRVADGDLESQDSGILRTEIRRMGEDFDAVILAIPVPVHERIASDLMVSDHRFRAMVEHHVSVVTVAAQVWTRRPLSELGWDGPPTISVNGGGPLSSWAEMSEVLPAEAWSRRPGALLYFVDTAPAEPFEEMTRRQAADAARRTVREGLMDPTSFPDLRGGLCHGRLEGEPIDAQYFRANIDPAERYVCSPAGSTRHRLGAESGFGGLWLAGDWTRTSINGGSVEAAAESGRRSAHALMGVGSAGQLAGRVAVIRNTG